MKNIFTKHYQTNYWANDESVSGAGSTLDATASIRLELPRLFEKYNIKSILDIPCGDYNWYSKLRRDVSYIGADIVLELIEQNKVQYPGVHFVVLDITKDLLPKVDLILCRDLFGHFSNWDIQAALMTIVLSRSKFLLATTFPNHETVGDIETGQWRPINMASSLVGLGRPLVLMNEGLKGQFADKSLGLWELEGGS